MSGASLIIRNQLVLGAVSEKNLVSTVGSGGVVCRCSRCF
jgi:hypothetical protein